MFSSGGSRELSQPCITSSTDISKEESSAEFQWNLKVLLKDSLQGEKGLGEGTF